MDNRFTVWMRNVDDLCLKTIIDAARLRGLEMLSTAERAEYDAAVAEIHRRGLGWAYGV